MTSQKGSGEPTSKTMELLLLVVLVLLPSCSGQFQFHCHGQPCPEYHVLETNENFEVGQYPPTDWISTSVEGSDLSAFGAARSKLMDFCGKCSVIPQQMEGLTVQSQTDKGGTVPVHPYNSFKG